MDGNPMEGATIAIVHRGGISLSMPSRSEHPTPLMGTKRTLASMGHVYVGKGKLDGAPLVIIPILGEGQKVSHLLLVHVRFDEGLSVREKIHVLGYKFNDIRNLVNEYNLPWEDAYIEPLGVSYLFSEPVEVIATRIKADMAPLEAGAGSRPTGPAGIANDLYNPDQTRRREK
jgi:glucosamine--fructose-6-phosphate aminotransferase (isomerizing)